MRKWLLALLITCASTQAAEQGVKALHCPSSNLKLGSGIAPVAAMRTRGICVSLGADGAACNNRLDMFDEMRLAATLQAMRRAPGSLTARDALWMATREGARAMGLQDELGSVEPGKRADLILVSRDRPHLSPDADPWSTLVYGARGTDIRQHVRVPLVPRRIGDLGDDVLDAAILGVEAVVERHRIEADAEVAQVRQHPDRTFRS